MNAKRVYGIDLGTTYSCIAHVDEYGKPVVLQNAEGQLVTPSVVQFESADNIVVGDAAKGAVPIFPHQCVSTIKRAMGDQWEQTFFGKTYKPQDVSSFILRKVVGDAEQITNEKIEDVVITCPAYFGVNEKEATKQAGELAGLNVLYVIPEPTAAALAYGIEQSDEQIVLVYDLGGGTFDVTVIEIKADAITVLCTGGDHQLGGKNWDDAIVSYLAEGFEEQTGTSADSLLEDQEAYQELLSAAETCKKNLSSRERVTQAVSFEGERVALELTREKFDEITAHYLERTLELTQKEIEKVSEKGYGKINQILLVGGSTFMPQVLDAVQERFPYEMRQFDPNQAVAKGAALFGYKCYLDQVIKIRVAEQTGQSVEEVSLGAADDDIVEQVKKDVAQDHGLKLSGLKAVVEKEIVNVSSKSFGIVVMNREDREVVANLIQVDDAVPRSITQKFGTYEEGQIQVDLRCMENQLQEETDIAVGDCTELGKAVLDFGKPLPRNSPVEVTFELGADGLLTLAGHDLTTGKRIDARFETESIMSREEVEAAKSRNLAIPVS